MGWLRDGAGVDGRRLKGTLGDVDSRFADEVFPGWPSEHLDLGGKAFAFHWQQVPCTCIIT